MPPLTGGTGLKPSEDGLSPSLKMTTAMTLLAIKTFRCVGSFNAESKFKKHTQFNMYIDGKMWSTPLRIYGSPG